MLTQWHLLPSLTSTVKSSLFTQAHSSPVFFAARLHQCHANHSHYINNDWTLSRQISLTLFLSIYVSQKNGGRWKEGRGRDTLSITAFKEQKKVSFNLILYASKGQTSVPKVFICLFVGWLVVLILENQADV